MTNFAAMNVRPRSGAVTINRLIQYAAHAPTAQRPIIISQQAVNEASRNARALRKAKIVRPTVFVAAPLRVFAPFLIPWDEHAEHKRSRQHEQLVSQTLNSLLRSGELVGTPDQAALGYNASNPAAWPPGTPTTVQDALDTLISQSYTGSYSVAISANWDVPYPTTVVSALDTLASRVQFLEDAGEISLLVSEHTWSDPISALFPAIQFTPDSPYIIMATGAVLNYHGPLFHLTPPVDGDYSWINQGSSTVSLSNGGIYLAMPANAADSWSFRVKTCPATPYTLTAYLMPLMMNVNYSGIALVLRKASDGTWIGFQQYCVSPDLYLSVGHGTNAGPAITVDDLGSVVIPQFYPWMRITDDGTTRKFWVSMDGNNFLQVYSQAHATPLVPDQIGFGVEARNSVYGIGLTVLSWVQS